LSEGEEQQSIIMDCLDYPLEAQLKLGCRRNYEGIVLCLCQSPLCNDEAPANIVDLPIARDCLKGRINDDGTFNYVHPKACFSNFCLRERNAIAPDYGSAPSVGLSCQDGRLFEKFDLFVYSLPFYLPVGICAAFQYTSYMITEVCTCPALKNCTSPSRFPGISGLPLDNRSTGFITCAIPEKPGFKQCTGHLCFIVKKDGNYVPAYGCLTYDDRFPSTRLQLGKYRLLDTAFFLCDTDMCNQNDVELDSAPPRQINGTCNCLPPAAAAAASPAVATTSDLPLILGIAVSAAILIALAVAVGVFRVVKGRWPVQMGGKRQTVTVISVVS
ncbi:hypothetical protein PMAYCL1PPCAC_13763, partial [Pristionchus mayeri]